jgi:hypothetical protein
MLSVSVGPPTRDTLVAMPYSSAQCHSDRPAVAKSEADIRHMLEREPLQSVHAQRELTTAMLLNLNPLQ